MEKINVEPDLPQIPEEPDDAQSILDHAEQIESEKKHIEIPEFDDFKHHRGYIS